MAELVRDPSDSSPKIEIFCRECRTWTDESPWEHVCKKPVGEWSRWTDDAVGRDFISTLAATTRAAALRNGAGC